MEDIEIIEIKMDELFMRKLSWSHNKKGNLQVLPYKVLYAT